jgi:hypothetical protein
MCSLKVYPHCITYGRAGLISILFVSSCASEISRGYHFRSFARFGLWRRTWTPLLRPLTAPLETPRLPLQDRVLVICINLAGGASLSDENVFNRDHHVRRLAFGLLKWCVSLHLYCIYVHT